MSASIQIRDWRPMHKGSLLGFAKVEMPSGMILHDVTVLSGERGAWASPPSKPQINRDGAIIKDDSGKTRYAPIIEFKSKETRQRFSDGVVEALRASHPKAFE